MFGNGKLAVGNVAVELLDDGRELGGTGLQVGDLGLEGLHLCRKFAPELDDLVDFGIGLLEFVEGLELLLDAHVGVCEILLQGNESLVLVDRRVYFLDGFLGCHIYSESIYLCIIIADRIALVQLLADANCKGRKFFADNLK